jgi:hypothetical protein
MIERIANHVVVDACMLTGSASKEEQRRILQRLVKGSDGKRISAVDASREDEIKLIYVTVCRRFSVTTRYIEKESTA